ncbi:MAG: hypothetical protein ACOCQ3_01195 [Natronomonas sp.]
MKDTGGESTVRAIDQPKYLESQFPMMATAPFLVFEGEEYLLDVSIRRGRSRLTLSDRGESLLVDELGYGNRDIVPWTTAKVLVLTGGAYERDLRVDSLGLATSLSGADGGANADRDELQAVGEYLRTIDVDERTVEAVREHVASTSLDTVLDSSEITSDRRHKQDLRDIATDLR